MRIIEIEKKLWFTCSIVREFSLNVFYSDFRNIALLQIRLRGIYTVYIVAKRLQKTHCRDMKRKRVTWYF